MIKYWLKNRLLLDVLIPILSVVILTIAFISPIFANLSQVALAKSLYKSDGLDFDVPSPSYEQIAWLEEEGSIESVFPYFFTKVELRVNGRGRETNVFFSDAFEKLDQTMYCEERLIEKGEENYSNPLLIDYQFARDMDAKIGSIVSVQFGSVRVEFQVSAIYETNTYYENGAVMAKWEGQQKAAIEGISPELTYSGAYIKATDILQCGQYLRAEYKPYGRLRDASEFTSQEAYEMHYNAFMAASYVNEIADFDFKGQAVKAEIEALERSAMQYKIVACIILVVMMLVANFLLWIRRSERGYFKACQLRGETKVWLYYLMSILIQTVMLVGGVILATTVVVVSSSLYIPMDIVATTFSAFVLVLLASVGVTVVENWILIKQK